MKIIDSNLVFTSPLTPIDPQKIDTVVIHHTVWTGASIEMIHDMHIKENGWAGVGYNAYIRKDGTIYKGRWLNIGAHTKGHNEHTFGIALEGDFNHEIPTPAQIIATVQLFSDTNLLPKLTRVLGHRDLNNDTECPGHNCQIITFLTSNIFNLSVQQLAAAGVIKSPEYWIENIEKPNPSYVKQLIINMARALK